MAAFDLLGLLKNIIPALSSTFNTNTPAKVAKAQEMQAIYPPGTLSAGNQPIQTSAPQSIPQPTSQPTSSPIAIAQDALRQNVAKLYGSDNPVLNYIPDLLEAGKKTPDPYLPLVIALRETQGGRDLQDPNKNANLGANNIFNIRNVRDAQGNIIGQPSNTKPFINYPDVHTAIFGGDNSQYGHQGGFLGQVNGPIYSDYRQSNNLKDFFNHYSPPADRNGALDEQVQNYQWIRNHILGIQ